VEAVDRVLRERQGHHVTVSINVSGIQLNRDEIVGDVRNSLATSGQFPIDVLKIDRSFVSGITDTSEAVVLVHAMVQLGKALGPEAVAEGVENDGQRRQLTAEQVDTVKGFLLRSHLMGSGEAAYRAFC
jgi:ammonium transporter, Amt family